MRPAPAPKNLHAEMTAVSYAPYLMIGLLMLTAVAGSSRFVRLVSVKDHIEPAPKPHARPHRLAHAALLLLVILTPASPSQAPVRNAPAAIQAGDDTPVHRGRRPCLWVKRVQPSPTTVS